MRILVNILENAGIMVLTIVALVGIGWLVLWILHWGLKFKSGSREEDGLVDLWASTMTKKPAAKDDGEEKNEE